MMSRLESRGEVISSIARYYFWPKAFGSSACPYLASVTVLHITILGIFGVLGIIDSHVMDGLHMALRGIAERGFARWNKKQLRTVKPCHTGCNGYDDG